MGISFLNHKDGKPSASLNDESIQAFNAINGVVSASEGSRVGETEGHLREEVLLSSGSSGDRLNSSKPNFRIGPSHNGPHILEPLSFDKACRDMGSLKCKKKEN